MNAPALAVESTVAARAPASFPAAHGSNQAPPVDASASSSHPLCCGPTLAPDAAREYRLRAIFDCGKLDPQVADTSVLAPFPLLIGREQWAAVAALAESLSREALDAEREMLGRPDLHRDLALPAPVVRALRRCGRRENTSGRATADDGPRLARFDLHWASDTFDGPARWQLSEVNADVPGGLIEAGALARVMLDLLGDAGASLTAPPDPAESLADALARRLAPSGQPPSGPIALIHATAFADDYQVMRRLAFACEHRGLRVTFAAPDHIGWDPAVLRSRDPRSGPTQRHETARSRPLRPEGARGLPGASALGEGLENSPARRADERSCSESHSVCPRAHESSAPPGPRDSGPPFLGLKPLATVARPPGGGSGGQKFTALGGNHDDLDNPTYGAAPIDRRTGEPLAALVRFYPAEWLPELSTPLAAIANTFALASWQGFFASGVAMTNPATALLVQSKRWPLLWDRLQTPLPTWRALLPETRDPRDATMRATPAGSPSLTLRARPPRDPHTRAIPAGWVLKPALGRVGEGIFIPGLPTRDERAIRKAARRHPRHWVAQRRFHSVPVDSPLGPLHVCLGVYVIDGRAAGLYARASTRPLIDQGAFEIPVLIQEAA